MKKAIVIAMVVALIFTVLVGNVAYAGSAFSNAKADFKARGDSGLPADASAQAIINYSKGQQNWQVQVNVRNLIPNTQYSVEVGTVNVWGGTIVTTFTTDSSGDANLHNMANNLPQTYSVARIITGSTPTQDGQVWRLKMIAQESGSFGLLKFRGTGRGK